MRPQTQMTRFGENSEAARQAIDQIVIWIEMVRHRLEKEFSLEWLETALLKGLREDRQPLTDLTIHAAEAGGDEICDRTLRRAFREQGSGTLPKQGIGYCQIWAYGLRVVERAPLERSPRGGRWHDNWMRNFQICMLVITACERFSVQPTREKKWHASGINLVVAAFNRAGLECPSEESIQKNIWFNLPGELVRATIPALISERI